MFLLMQESVPFVSALILIGVAAFLFTFSKFKRNGPQKRVPRDAVLIYGVGRGVAAPCASPFPLKLETFCRMANIPYMVDHSGKMSSKGKTPWMEYNGQAIADSQFCIEHLKTTRDLDLDADLSPSVKAQARAFRELTEENLYWTMCYELFVKHPDRLGRAIPYTGVKLWALRVFLGRAVGRQLWAQGIGRHSDHQIWQIASTDLSALSHFLGEKKFFCGDSPHEVDCAIFGMVSQILYHMPGSRFEAHVRENLPNLVAFVERMRSRFWPDWDKRCKGGDYEEDGYKLYTPGQIKVESLG